MAKNAQFGLSLRVLAALAEAPETMQTSAKLAASVGASAVVIRRIFVKLSRAGLIVQRKGPNGGARLKRSAKEIGLGDIYRAVMGDWLGVHSAALNPLLRRTEDAACDAMNDTTLSQVVKRLRKAS